jgi:hypothetical protein
MANNVIELQDEYVNKINSYDVKGRNYYTLRTKAAKKFAITLYDLGFGVDFIVQAKKDADDMAQLGRYIWKF